MRHQFHRQLFWLSTLFLFLHTTSIAQTLKGKIVDENTKQSIPFAFIGIENSNKGTTADIDGNFSLKLDSTMRMLTVQVIGYQKKQLKIKELSNYNSVIITLKSAEVKLDEIVVTPNENPANELIRQLIRNKKKLDPRNLEFYSCETYGKTYFTISDSKGNEFYYKEDTSKFSKEKKLLEKQYLFFIESASEKRYLYKNIQQEKIIASRVSGFKSAPFASLASQLQSFTFFDDNIDVLDIKYVNPLLKGTFKRYNFNITDTIIESTDTTILIAFEPKKNSNFKALKGVLYMNKNDNAIANVLAEPVSSDGKNAVKIQQKYIRLKDKQWFPTQLVTEILFNTVNASSSSDSGPNRIMKCVSKLYVSNVNLDSTIQIKQKNIEVVNAKGYENKDELFWEKKRLDSLTAKERNTYHVVDSVGKAEKFEAKLKLAKILSTGQIPLGIISFDLKRLMKVNDYEGFRLGGGIVTNDKLSKWFSVGGYGAYGFTDKAWKYGGDLQINLSENKEVNLKGELARDVFETANTTFHGEKNSFISTQNIRTYLVGMMDKVSYAKASFQFPIQRFIKASVYAKITERVSPSGYGNINAYYNDHHFLYTSNEAGIQLKIWPFEKFTESFLGLISLGSKAPCFYINYSQTIPALRSDYQNSFTFQKIDIKLDHKINFKVKGYFAYQIQAGKVFGDVPYTFQFNNNGSRTEKYRISAENTFETMYLNEFISTEYVTLFTSLNSGKILRKNKFCNPEFELVHAVGYGKLLNKEKLTYIPLNDMQNIYTEAGLRIKNLYTSGMSSFGAGAFYRYGSYTNTEIMQNLVFKFVLGITLN